MADVSKELYCLGMSPQALAERVLKDRFGHEMPSVPIDPFKMMRDADQLTISEFVFQALKIHHRITQIHPFRDGNGRSSRALLNWMLREKGLPPIYFKLSEKESYYAALGRADKHGDYTELLRITIRELFRTVIRVKQD